MWRRLADAKADLSLRWAHSHFIGFVMMRLKCSFRSVMKVNAGGAESFWEAFRLLVETKNLPKDSNPDSNASISAFAVPADVLIFLLPSYNNNNINFYSKLR